LYWVEQTTDGGFILGGTSGSDISGDKTENTNGIKDYWIVKTDSLGSIQWQNTIGGNLNDHLTSISEISDGSYILGGSSLSDSTGDKTENTNGSTDFWILKTDAGGTIQWQNTIGGSDADALNIIRPTSDGGYILGGYTQSHISGDKTENCYGGPDYWIVKLGPDTVTRIEDVQLAEELAVYPNPAATEIKIMNCSPSTQGSGCDGNALISVCDLIGNRMLMHPAARGMTSDSILDISGLSPGIYIVEVSNSGINRRARFIKQ
jgi:hypothetical protein